MPLVVIRLTLSIICIVFAVQHAFADADQTVSIEFSGPVEMVVNWQRERCEDIDIPDMRLHAFRRFDNKIIGVASHYVTYTLIGDDISKLRKNGCQLSFSSSKNSDPSMFDDQTWIAATWTDDGKNIAAIGHHEYHGELHSGMCAGKTPRQCRYGSLMLLGSNNGGETFRQLSWRPIAAVGVPQMFSQGKDVGFFHPSNIMEWDGNKYAFVRTSGGGQQPPATCLMRSMNPLNPSSWEIFDGNSFRLSSFDPYHDDVSKNPICKQISGLNGMVVNLLRHRHRKVFIAVLVVIEPKSRALRLATSVSNDLLHWPKAKLVEGVNFEWKGECGDGPIFHYPSLLDPDAPGRNFDTTDDEVYLFMTSISREGCKGTMDRDLIMRPVHLVFH